MSEITDFLRARYAEARDRQQRIVRGTWEPGACCPVCSRPTSGMTTSLGGQSIGWPLGSFDPCGHEVHEASVMTQFEEPAPDPDVIADLDAKLALIEEHPDVNDGSCGTCVDGRWGYPTHGGSTPQRHPCRTLRLLAQPFAGHPDHKGEEWAP
ncbi:DUF6221 family protein [Streptomyces sp. M41(2017)]|uniref:DUF6221 family protein n=1 Tax=Streptomyces sp. M41(2017) TaxID=1955065 RepID=UPI0009C15F6A|nr:DUF6221 family protein [Streptomyces sp. M41(2017)]